MTLFFRRTAVALAWGTALFAGMIADAKAADGADEFYKGKQIRLIVSADSGAAYDTYARLMAQILKEHIPGSPSIIVQNMPGASGLKTANYMYTVAPRDGTVIASTLAAVLTMQLTSPGAATFEANKVSWIGSITSDPFIGYVWHTTRIKSLDDMRTTETVMGGVGLGSASADYAIMAKEMFGLKFKVITGYLASTDVKLAMERGEVDGTLANAWSCIRTSEPE